jgi:hypothetical protein
MSRQLECPYCERMNEVPEDSHGEDEHYECQCSECDKTFGFTVSYWPSYTEYIMPCANGGDHNFEQIMGAPREHFINKFRCSHCGEERTINPES